MEKTRNLLSRLIDRYFVRRCTWGKVPLRRSPIPRTPTGVNAMRGARRIGPGRNDLILAEVLKPKTMPVYHGDSPSDCRRDRDFGWYLLRLCGWSDARISRSTGGHWSAWCVGHRLAQLEAHYTQEAAAWA
jgi:hypothetical protein